MFVCIDANMQQHALQKHPLCSVLRNAPCENVRFAAFYAT
jgi:hypothetical protein